MMFMMPTPPTTSEIKATTNKSVPIVCVAEARVRVSSAMSRMLKSSASPE